MMGEKDRGDLFPTTKEELARKYPTQKCCVKAELAAIVRASGSLHLRANHSYAVTVHQRKRGFDPENPSYS